MKIATVKKKSVSVKMQNATNAAKKFAKTVADAKIAGHVRVKLKRRYLENGRRRRKEKM